MLFETTFLESIFGVKKSHEKYKKNTLYDDYTNTVVTGYLSVYTFFMFFFLHSLEGQGQLTEFILSHASHVPRANWVIMRNLCEFYKDLEMNCIND